MVRRSFRHELLIDVEPVVLHTFLADIHNHRDLHPLIISIEDLPASAGAQHVRRYEVTDRVRVGPVPMRVTYTAAVEVLDGEHIRAEAWQKPGVHVVTSYILRSDPGGTLLSEEVVLDAPALLAGFVTRQARAAHHETLIALKELLERR